VFSTCPVTAFLPFQQNYWTQRGTFCRW